MPPAHSAAAPPAVASRRDALLHLLFRAFSPSYGSRRNAAAALQALVATAPERRAAATPTTAGPHSRRIEGGVRGAGEADRAAVGRPR